ncbi:MAG: hypothetical protein ACK54L_02350 [Betaproteobacteria bacterium]
MLAAVLVACGSRSADPHGTAVQAVAGPVAERLVGAAAGRGLAGVSVAPDGLAERAPQSMLVREGDSVLFSVEAVGTAPLQYQWLRDGATIAGARGPLLRIDAAQRADDGAHYQVEVSNSAGRLLSPAAHLAVERFGWRAPWD